MNGYKRVCYASEGVSFSTLNPFLCTHILLFVLNVNWNGVAYINSKGYKFLQFANQLKEVNRNILIGLTIAGNSSVFAPMACSSIKRERFSKSSLKILQETNTDGVDLDWEFPGFETVGNEKRCFTLLLKALSFVFKRVKHRPFLSAAVAAPFVIVDHAYEVAQIAKYVDFITVMTYDFSIYSAITPYTGHNSPLLSDPDDSGYFAKMNFIYSMLYWLKKGMPTFKLLAGLPTYGRGFKLKDSRYHNVYAPAIGPWRDGYANFSSICKFLDSGGTETWDKFSFVPYAYKNDHWISFDNTLSLIAKVTTAKSMRLAGVMIFSLNHDDAYGICGRGPYPLLNEINLALM